MKLEQLFNLVSESTNLYIYADDELTAEYNGKNSIPEDLNSADVERIQPINNNLNIFLKE